jgi:hypothetical protein
MWFASLLFSIVSRLVNEQVDIHHKKGEILMKRLALILLALFISFAPAWAQDFGSVSGRVTQGDGVVANAWIGLFSLEGGNNNQGPQPQFTQTDREGRYRLPEVLPGRWLVQAALPNGGAPQSRQIEVRANANTEVNFAFEGQGQNDGFGIVFGTVTLNGNAVANATVILNPADPNDGRRARSTRTGENGQYRLVQVIAGNWIASSILAQGRVIEHQIALQDGQELEVNFEFGADQQDEVGSIFGRVTLNGEPVAGAMVVVGADGNNGGQMLAAQTGRDGGYRFDDVLVGEYPARAMLPDGRAQAREVRVNAGEETELNFAFEGDGGGGGGDREFGGVAGLVSNSDGNPLRGAEVLLVADPADGQNGDNRQFRQMTHTNEQGRYSFQNVPLGACTVAAARFGYIPQEARAEVALNEVTEVDFVLQPVEELDIPVGSIGGFVTDIDGAAIEQAHVLVVIQVEGGNGNPNGGREGRFRVELVGFTDDQGAYLIEDVPAGAGRARAAKRGYRPADAEVQIVENEVAEVNFVLEVLEDGGNGGGNGGGEGRHNGEMVELRGTAIVIEGDVADVYLLDADADGAADYILNFGPPEYDPGNGAARPADGDQIVITGRIIGHMDPPMVVVLTINDRVWRDPENGGHGGRPGGGNGWNGDPNLELVEAEGNVIFQDREAPWHDRWGLNTNDDVRPEFRLFFGEDDYDPGNGVQRPADGDFVNILGGLFQPRNGLPVIVVYQINGQFWREPGDTLQLLWIDPNEVKDPGLLSPITPVLVSSYPNPFNNQSTVQVALPTAGRVRVSLLDLTGKELIPIAEGYFAAGRQELDLNAELLGSGEYFLRIETASGGVIQKVTLLK